MASTDRPSPPRRPWGFRFKLTAALPLALVFSGACASSTVEIPAPRALIIHSGERIRPEKERMDAVHAWVSEEVDSITLDPSFMITTIPEEGPVQPWESLTINELGDSANIRIQRTAFDARGAFLIYAHLHLMAAQNRLDRWLPEALGSNEYELERAILDRVAETWLYQRSLFDARPYGLLDELLYARENGYLDAYILTSRTNDFVDARREWQASNPEAPEEYRAWFLKVFRREPPGLRGGSSGS